MPTAAPGNHGFYLVLVLQQPVYDWSFGGYDAHDLDRKRDRNRSCSWFIRGSRGGLTAVSLSRGHCTNYQQRPAPRPSSGASLPVRGVLGGEATLRPRGENDMFMLRRYSCSL